MSEWWTYRPEDFLLFSERVYWRLIELHNLALWPWHIPALLTGVVILYLVWQPRPWSGRIISALLALLWALVAWAFLWQRYTSINWAATYLAVAYLLQAGLWLVIGVLGKGIQPSETRHVSNYLGLGLLFYAVLLHPLSSLLVGHFPIVGEVFGITPDPLVIASLGVLTMVRGMPWLWLLWPIPMLWCLLSWLTLQTMGSPTAWLPLGALIIALVAKIKPITL